MGNSKIKVDARDIAELIENYNPFGFKDSKQRIMVFRDYEAAYIELIDRLYQAGPMMVDAVLFLKDNLGMPIIEAQDFVRLWKFVVGQKEDDFFFDWKKGGYYLDAPLERFAKGMHLLSETRFNKDMFKSALEKIKAKYNVNQ